MNLNVLDAIKKKNQNKTQPTSVSMEEKGVFW